jgi:hypothetical protein
MYELKGWSMLSDVEEADYTTPLDLPVTVGPDLGGIRPIYVSVLVSPLPFHTSLAHSMGSRRSKESACGWSNPRLRR